MVRVWAVPCDVAHIGLLAPHCRNRACYELFSKSAIPCPAGHRNATYVHHPQGLPVKNSRQLRPKAMPYSDLSFNH